VGAGGGSQGRCLDGAQVQLSTAALLADAKCTPCCSPLHTHQDALLPPLPPPPALQAKANKSCMDYGFHMAVTKWNKKVESQGAGGSTPRDLQCTVGVGASWGAARSLPRPELWTRSLVCCAVRPAG
jgi:hypothetical protein